MSDGPARPLVIATWNLQGSAGVDIDEAVRRLAATGPGRVDVLALQEVQRGQARALAMRLGLHGSWRWKHWPIVHRTEGLALLTAHPVIEARAIPLTRAMFWSWRRRVGIVARIEAPGGPLIVGNVHPSPHDDAARRVRELARFRAALARLGPLEHTVVLGDLNDLPGGPAPAALVAGGWQDVWAVAHGDEPGPTNWTGGDRAGRPPTQRLDFVFVPPGWGVVEVIVPPADGHDGWDQLSDHLPVVALVERR